MDSLLTYSDSDKSVSGSDEDDVMNVNSKDRSPPLIPLSPCMQESQTDATSMQMNVRNLLQQHETHERYYEHTFQNGSFEDNPELIPMLLRKLQIFDCDDPLQSQPQLQNDNGDNVMDGKLDEYSSAISTSIHNPRLFRFKEDNVDTLMLLLEQKLKETEQRMQERQERKEKQKQLMMKEKTNKKRHNENAYSSSHAHHARAIVQAAHSGIVDHPKQYTTQKKKRSRWDHKK